MVKVIYSKETILAKAFDMAVDVGMTSITARTLAKRIGCSTAPIYTAYKNIDELKSDIQGKTYEKINEWTLVPYTDDTFLNIGVGLLVFARDYTNLYREIFINSSTDEFGLKYLEEFVNRMKTGYISDLFTHGETRIILSKMWVFTHGLATIICSGRLKKLDTQYFVNLLAEAGLEIMTATALKSGKIEKFMKEFYIDRGDDKFHTPDWEVW